MLIVTGHQKVAVGSNHVAGQEIVDTEPESPHQVADPAAQSQSTDAGVSDDATGYGESERLALVIKVAPQGTALSSHRSGQRIHSNAGHLGQVDHQTAITHRMPRHGMSPASDRDR